jgi:catechol 2,3-dioxygenase-like lactoylglutathione lyase family enzyme
VSRHLAHIALVVDNYDRAIAYYTQTLGFELIEDTALSETKRWVLVSPGKEAGCQLLLAQAATPEQESRIGNQTGGRVFLFLHTTTFDADYANLLAKNVKIIRPITQESFGRVSVFEDQYGNLWDLIEKA